MLGIPSVNIIVICVFCWSGGTKQFKESVWSVLTLTNTVLLKHWCFLNVFFHLDVLESNQIECSDTRDQNHLRLQLIHRSILESPLLHLIDNTYGKHFL